MSAVQLSLHELSEFVLMYYQYGNTREDVVQALVGRGWPKDSAVRFVADVLNERQKRMAAADTPGVDGTSEEYDVGEERQQVPDKAPEAPHTPSPATWKTWFVVVFLVVLMLACLISTFVH